VGLAIVLVLIIVVVAACVIYVEESGPDDETRLSAHLEEEGSTLIGMVAQRGGGISGGRIKTGPKGGYVYDITYEDAEGRTHFAECETGKAIGVILRRDGIREKDAEAE